MLNLIYTYHHISLILYWHLFWLLFLPPCVKKRLKITDIFINQQYLLR